MPGTESRLQLDDNVSFCSQMHRLPGKGCYPLRMTFHSLTFGLPSFRVPQPDMAVMAATGELSFHRMPLDAKDPSRVAHQCV